MPAPLSKLITAAAFACLYACSSHETIPVMGEEIPPDAPLMALQAYHGEDQYFLRYLRDGSVYYMIGDLPRRTSEIINQPDPGGDYGDPAIDPIINASDENDWLRLTGNLTPVPVLDIDQWTAFRAQVFDPMVPAEENTGAMVSFDRADYFFFYDKQGLFRTRRLIDKPPWYKVTKRIDLAQHFESWQPVLQKFLQDRGFSGNQVLFNTGDLDRGAFPFIYINTDRRLILLIRTEDIPAPLNQQIPGGHILHSLWHFVGSHSYHLPMRPFSSVQSLLSLVSDTALESGKLLFTGLPQEPYIPSLSQAEGMDLQQWEQHLDDLLGRKSSRGRINFLVDGDTFFPHFIDAVTSAEKSVDLRAYIFDNDDVALTIAELLRRRSREGIDVKVLFDGLGTYIAGGEKSRSLPEGHQTPLSVRAYMTEDSPLEARTVKNTWLAGDHVKTMVIDRHQAYLGGMNVGREYRYDWHDLMMEITGPVVDEINHEFDKAWAQAGLFGDFGMLFARRRAVNEDAGGYPLRLVYTRPGQNEIYKAQRDAIRRSQRYIYIENAYFTDDSMLRELVAARRRGVDVRVIIPLETDSGFITRNIALAANAMLEHGIRVYIYPGFTHAKAAIFDDWVCVGSANLDRLSLKVNREINIATSDPGAVQELKEELFEPDFRVAREMTEPFPEQFSDYLIEVFGDYIF